MRKFEFTEPATSGSTSTTSTPKQAPSERASANSSRVNVPIDRAKYTNPGGSASVPREGDVRGTAPPEKARATPAGAQAPRAGAGPGATRHPHPRLRLRCAVVKVYF